MRGVVLRSLVTGLAATAMFGVAPTVAQASCGQYACAGSYRVQTTGGNTLNVRSGPGTGYSWMGSLGSGSWVNLDCQKSGTSVGGDPIWDHISQGSYAGGYVS